MRPVYLKMSAFGPFAGVAEVDFTLLGTEGVYLLAGETGAGKTTVFDAITFALFGRCSGEGRKPENLRSDFAGPDTQTYVDLTFDLRGKRYRIVRDPGGYERNKKRGSGTTKSDGDASIELPDGSELTGRETVNAKVTELLGIDANQFGQIVMLAQGDFEKLLCEGTSERTEIFRKIFGTDLYRRFQDELTARKNELAAKCREADHEVELLAKQALGAMPEGDEPRGRIEGWMGRAALNAGSVLEALDDELALTQGRHDEASQALAQARSEHDRLALAQDRAKQAAQTRSDLARAQQGLAGLEAALPGLQDARDKAQHDGAAVPELQRRAGALREQLPSYERHGQALDTAQKAGTELAEARAAQERAQADAAARERALTGLATQAEQLAGAGQAAAEARAATQAAQQALRDAEGLKASVEGAQACEAAIRDAQDRLGRAKTFMEELDEADAEAHRAIEEQKAVEARLSGAADALSQAKLDAQKAQTDLAAVQELAHRLDALKADLKRKQEGHAQAAQAYTRAADAHTLAAQEVERLRRAREDGLAGVLAAGLRAGHACPVCGSLDHPNPAQGAQRTPSREDVQAAQEREAAARRQSSELCGKAKAAFDLVEAAQEELATFVDANGDAPALAEREREVRACGQDAARKVIIAQGQADELAACRNAQARLQADIDKRAHTRKAGQDRVAQLTAEQSRQEGQLKAALDAITASGHAREDAPALYEAARAALAEAQDRQAQLEREAERSVKVEEARQAAQAALDTAREELEARKQRAQAAAQAAEVAQERVRTLAAGLEFADEAQARQAIAEVDSKAAALTAALDQATRALEENARQRAAAQSTCDALATRLAELGDLDLARIEAELAGAASTLAQAQGSERACDQALRTLNDLHGSLTQLAQRHGRLQDASARAERLARVAEGTMTGKGRLSFETFVQMRYFEVVLHAANTRLIEMTQGQYELVRSERLAGNTKIGLDVDVLDNCTGKARTAKSLSGGEKFMASLALALGLSEVVQRQAGGIQLDTMFVDEGFGSLDQEKLRLVMRAMTRPGSAGKLVGIISHVEELMETIDRKIVVERGHAGSTLRVEV